MKRMLVLSTVAIAFGASSAVAGPNLLFNGNLDQTVATEVVPGFFLPKPAGWVNLGSRTLSGPYNDSLSSEPWAGPAPTPVTADGSGLPGPDGCDGPDCGAFFKPFTGNTTTDGPATGHLYQDVPGSEGVLYTLTGWAGAEANFFADGAVFALDFLDAGGNLLNSVELDLFGAGLFDPNGQPFNYKEYSLSGTSPAGTAFVRARASMIDGISNPAGGGQAFVVDDFVLTPEPTSLLLLGLGAASLLRRR
jgi:hypothetical protein